MAYQRASSYASANVLGAVWEYLEAYKNPVTKGDDMDLKRYEDELKKHNNELREKVNNIFKAIREDVQTTTEQQYYEF
jgi:hypothetical protein